jgi:[ribosomal protein S5]-alanine N-acetyltransferase
MESYWPTLVENPSGNKPLDDFAVLINNISKIVYSRTLKNVEWENTILKKEVIKHEILKLKQEKGKSILAGSPSLIVEMAQLDLVDEYQLCIHPVVLGRGLPLFKNISDKINLRLLKTKTFGCGAVAFYYEQKKKNSKIEIVLRKTEIADLEFLFEFQLDQEANHLAAFTSKDPADKSAYIQKYSKFLSNPTINNQTIIVGNRIVGSIAKFEIEGKAELTYWIDKKFWGQGVATKALEEFLKNESMRPIIGRTAFDNFGSQKVLEKCHFIKIGKDKGFANSRQAEIEEYIYKLS